MKVKLYLPNQYIAFATESQNTITDAYSPFNAGAQTTKKFASLLTPHPHHHLYFSLSSASAFSALSKAIELKPDYADAYLNGGIMLRRRRDNSGAYQDFTTAASLPQDRAPNC